MAPRVRATMESDDVDRSYPESSPDPLAGSVFESAAKTRRKATRAPKEPLSRTSPSKQNTRSSMSQFDFSSPSKSMIMNTPKTHTASPWRIKVTVEAEPGSDEENASPIVKHVTRTKTTMIPLKDADAPSPVKRRGRPRKSEAATSAKPKRVGTPVRRRKNSRTRSESIGAADVDTDTAPKRRRGRPRKSVQPPTEDEETIVVEEPVQELPTTEAPSVTSEEPLLLEANVGDDMSTPEPDIELNMTVPAIEETAATPQDTQRNSAANEVPGSMSHASPRYRSRIQAMMEHEESMVFSPPETHLRKQLRARKSTPAAKRKSVVEISSDEESDGDDHVHTPSGTDDEPAATESQHVEPTEAPRARDFAMDPPLQSFVEPDEDEDEDVYTATLDDGGVGFQDITHFAFDEGTTRMPDDTTVLESENFSMISVDSLPSSGGLSSPPKEDIGYTPMVRHTEPALDDEYLKISPVNIRQSRGSPQIATRSSLGSSHVQTAPRIIRTSPAVASTRQKTPVIDSEAPTQPPAIEPVRSSPPKPETPKLGRVVKAGCALQGVLDPNRVTPEASQKALEEQRDRLDDLFRGFSEGTRRELQAGLRLGEQLAQQSQSSQQSSPSRSSPLQDKDSAGPAGNVFDSSLERRKLRLLTPEDQDDDVRPTSPPQTGNADVQHSPLNIDEQGSQLVSPEGSPDRSMDEMSWRVDTPPMAISAEGGRFMTVKNEYGELLRGAEISVVADEDEEEEEEAAAAAEAKEDYADIWQEEASRSSDLPEPQRTSTEKSPQLQDLFPQDGLMAPPRRKLPGTWRRNSSNNFQYSDEAEEVQEPTPPATEPVEPPSSRPDKGKGKMIEPAVELQSLEEEDDISEASDDTGMFFQSNMPSLFNKKRSAELRKKKAEKLDLSLLMNEGASLLPESSPPIAKKTPPVQQSDPSFGTPPKFPILKSSPVKSSPLRQEYRASDSLSDVHMDESSLPLPQSSPFRTHVDDDTYLSTASDQHQFRVEMEGVSDSSTRRIRNEADEYLEAYQAEDRTLGGITEVTEPSRSWNKETTIMPSSPPQVGHTFEQSMLAPKRTYAPLFGQPSPVSEADGKMDTETDESSSPASVNAKPEFEPSVSSMLVSAEEPEPQSMPAAGGIFSRLWGAFRGTGVPSQHPILAQYCLDHLPKVEPWTKTHYKTLDYLFQLYKKSPTLFAPSSSTSTTSNVNDALLSHFLSIWKKPFVGAEYSAWGYCVTMDESVIVLCAAYMQLLTFEDVWEYERVLGKAIQVGDCDPGLTGTAIGGEQVVRRLATIIMGEEVRRDERKGRKIKRVGGMRIEWPR